MLDQIKETSDFLKKRMKGQPKIAIVLGSGLGGLVDYFEIKEEIPYAEIPNFPESAVKGHKGSWIFATMNGTDVIIQNGRFHFYEGYNMKTVTLPVRIFKELGVETLFLSNAVGGLNPSFKVGDIMIINDHINFMFDNPLWGKNYEELGPRFPDMTDAYSPRLRQLAHQTAEKLGITLHEGVYVGVMGPNFETKAECRMFRTMGADVVGMSTVPEVIVARHSDMEVFAMSVITNLSLAPVQEKSTHESVLEEAQLVGPRMSSIVYEMISQL